MCSVGAAAAVPAVRVVTKDSLRVKRISAEVQVQASVEQVMPESRVLSLVEIGVRNGLAMDSVLKESPTIAC